MKKLRSKVFWVIFGIISITALGILVVFNWQDYNREKSKIDNSMMRLIGNPINAEKNFFKKDAWNAMNFNNFNRQNELKEEKTDINILQNEIMQDRKLIVDYIAYVVTYENDEITGITSHFQDDEEYEEEVEKVAKEILKKVGNDKNIRYVGNLYFEKYSYFINDNTLVIVYNSKGQERLIEDLKTSAIILVLVESIIFLIAIMLTNWIIKPVEKAFNKQKQFIEDASHELKTPLTVIMASAEALEKNKFETKWIDNIKEESEKMTNLVSSMLDMAKTERCEVQYNKENLSKLVEKSVLTYESLMFDKSIRFEYEIDPNIELYCSDMQIKQVIGILVDNAIQHSSDEGEIHVSLKRERNEIKLKVSNKGDTIPKAVQERIFERFYRADESRNRSSNRYGLGLAIAKNIVENHNGRITVESENGITTFAVFFK